MLPMFYRSTRRIAATGNPVVRGLTGALNGSTNFGATKSSLTLPGKLADNTFLSEATPAVRVAISKTCGQQSIIMARRDFTGELFGSPCPRRGLPGPVG